MAVQGQVKLAVGETASQPVGRVHRERGLADPGHPADRADTHHPTASGQAIQPFRQPVKLGPAAGEADDVPRQPAGRGRGERPRGRPPPGRHHVLGQAPPARAATNNSATAPGRPSARASNTAVSLRAVRLMPRSRSLTGRGLTPAASASSSCVSRVSARSRRSSPANVSAGSSTTAVSPLTPCPSGGQHPANRAWTHCTQTARYHHLPPSSRQGNPTPTTGDRLQTRRTGLGVRYALVSRPLPPLRASNRQLRCDHHNDAPDPASRS